MNWIFDNIQLIIIVGSTIAWWLTQRNQEEEDAPKPGERPGRQKIDVEQLERNRRLREEIRRKREARRSGAPEPETATQERESSGYSGPEVPQEMAEQIPPVLRELMGIPEPAPPPPPAPPPIPDVNPVLERQERMQQEMAELEAKRREAEAMAARAGRPGGGGTRRRRRVSSSATSLDDADFLATLRDPRQARRAIVLREILSKPVAMR